MIPDRLAFIAGETWLASGVTRAPTENDLAEVASRLDPLVDSLEVVRSCVEVAEAVAWVLACRKAHPWKAQPRLVLHRGGKGTRNAG